MLLEFDVKKLESAIFDFYNSTGVSISVLGEDFSPLGTKKGHNLYCRLIQSSKKGFAECLKSTRFLLEECKRTKKPMMRMCHAGLVEIAVPIIYREEAIGYVMLGHVRKAGYEADIKECTKELPIDHDLANEIFSSLCAYEGDKIESIMNMAEMFGRFIILENLLHPRENENLERIKRYVQENVEKRLTAQLIARGAHISKSSLYNIIHEHFGCTVSEYINQVKIDKAKELLTETDLTVELISERLAFSSPAYFGKVFKRALGISPLKFRKTYTQDT